MQSPVQQTNTSRSKQLRNWYLAGLRKRLFADSKNLTPAALVNADRQFIEELILTEANTHLRADSGTSASSGTAPWFLCWLGGNALLFLFLVFRNSGDIGQSLLQDYQLTLGLLLTQEADRNIWAELGWLTGAFPAFFYGFPFAAAFVATICSSDFLDSGAARSQSKPPGTADR